jgi:hypothetical protein
MDPGTNLLLFQSLYDVPSIHETYINNYVTLEVFTAVATNLTVFWNLTPCSLVEMYQHSAGTRYLHLQCRRPSEAGGRFTENVGTSLLD